MAERHAMDVQGAIPAGNNVPGAQQLPEVIDFVELADAQAEAADLADRYIGQACHLARSWGMADGSLVVVRFEGRKRREAYNLTRQIMLALARADPVQVRTLLQGQDPAPERR